MSTKKRTRCQSTFGRLGYSIGLAVRSRPLLEPTAPAPVVKKTMQNENIVPIASLFSSTDFTQPTVATNRRPSTASGIPMQRSFSFHRYEPPPAPAGSCDHHGLGQELCHPCHERARRNIPVYLHDERRARDAEEAKLLEQYRHDRDVDERRKQEVRPSRRTTRCTCPTVSGGDESDTRGQTTNGCSTYLDYQSEAIRVSV